MKRIKKVEQFAQEGRGISRFSFLVFGVVAPAPLSIVVK